MKARSFTAYAVSMHPATIIVWKKKELLVLARENYWFDLLNRIASTTITSTTIAQLYNISILV